MDTAESLGGDQAGFKDAVLNDLAERANIAQFVSFEPGPVPKPRFARVQGYEPGYDLGHLDEAIRALLQVSPEHSVNVRSFHPDRPKSGEFLYGLTKVPDVAAAVRRLASSGFYAIVNETVDVNDGGVSGVSYARILEFAPGDTPRCVEKPGTVSIASGEGLRMLELVYGFRPELDYEPATRVEFSIHPIRRGFRRRHTIVWELEPTADLQLAPNTRWPNRFSRMLGDKTFGLLIADLLGLPVPSTTVVSRAIPPFRFGQPTGSGEPWIRTCPEEQVPGLFTTRHGWLDPFRLVANEDPEGKTIASVLWQEGVDAAWSGALAVGDDGHVITEGVAGPGDAFMQGRVPPEPIPAVVEGSVTELQRRASAALGPVKMEWVHDGTVTWVVQLHRIATPGSQRVIYPGDARLLHSFDVADGIDELRKLIARIEGTGDGVVLLGDVGVTSHMGDLLRRARIPARLEPRLT